MSRRYDQIGMAKCKGCETYTATHLLDVEKNSGEKYCKVCQEVLAPFPIDSSDTGYSEKELDNE